MCKVIPGPARLKTSESPNGQGETWRSNPGGHPHMKACSVADMASSSGTGMAPPPFLYTCHMHVTRATNSLVSKSVVSANAFNLLHSNRIKKSQDASGV